MVTLHNVIDTRTNTIYSVAIVPEKYTKYFIQNEEESV